MGGINLANYPEVAIRMEDGGAIRIELYPQIAPNTVRNFLSLVQQEFYNGLIFYRVIPGFIIQGGCPEGTGTGSPGYRIKGEFTNNGYKNDLKHERGIVSMARGPMPDTAGSQFFIVVEAASHLDGDYAAFGKVVEGMEEVDKIANCERDDSNKPIKAQVMKEVVVKTFGDF